MFKISIISDEQVTNDKSGFLGDVTITQDCSSLTDFAAVITEFHICCGVFLDNKRNKSSFQHIQFLQFDFDNGTEPAYVTQKMGTFSYVLAASKNHMKDKNDGKGVIPRFHLFLPLSSPITDGDFYSFAIQELGKNLSLDYDRAAKDCSRYFFRHSSILKLQDAGLLFNPESLLGRYDVKKMTDKQNEEKLEKLLQRQKESGGGEEASLKNFQKTKVYREMLNGSLRNDGGRNVAFMSILGTAKKCGVDKLTAISLVVENSTWGSSYTKKRVVNFADDIWRR
jgi:hypothetical protein